MRGTKLSAGETAVASATPFGDNDRNMRTPSRATFALIILLGSLAPTGRCDDAPLPAPVKAVWDLNRAWRETTLTRQRICVNGLWRWQPADANAQTVPEGAWGYFKVPGSWPGITDYLQKESQTLYAHPSWKDQRLAGVTTAWYQREIEIPAQWKGRKIGLSVEYLNSLAAVYVDGK
jgi:hypothetical protein